MNNSRKFELFIIIALICVFINSCDLFQNNENPGGVYLTGTYGRRVVSSATINDRLIFTSTTFSTTDTSGPFLSGTYRFDGARLTLTIGGINHDKYATFRENIITITGEGAYSEFFNDTWTAR